MVNLEQRRNRHITGIMIPVQLAISEPFRLEICYLIFFFNTCLNLKKCHKSALFLRCYNLIENKRKKKYIKLAETFSLF